jgi:hypothetical protein
VLARCGGLGYESNVRSTFAAIVLTLALGFAGCYDQPTVPRDKPLACKSNDEGECPTGYSCIANRVCALRLCGSDLDCPLGLACLGNSCGLPVTDGGGDGLIVVAPGEGSETPDAREAGVEVGATDALPGIDPLTPADAAGGGQ